MRARIRKLATIVDETHVEMGRDVSPPTRRAAAVAVIANPFAGRYEGDLEELMAIGEELGDMLGRRAVAALGIVVDQGAIRARWDQIVDEVLQRATLTRPADGPMRRGGRVGRHTEHLGHLLAVMQSVARAHPGATW